MTDAEIKARLIVLEVLTMGTLGIVFAITGPDDPTNQKAIAVLDSATDGVKMRLAETDDADVRREGLHYLDTLTSELSEGLGIVRKRGQSPGKGDDTTGV